MTTMLNGKECLMILKILGQQSCVNSEYFGVRSNIPAAYKNISIINI